MGKKKLFIMLASCVLIGSVCSGYSTSLKNKSLPSIKPEKITAVCKADNNMSPEEARELYKLENLTEEQRALIEKVDKTKKEAINNLTKHGNEEYLEHAVYGYLNFLKNGELASIIEEHKNEIKSLNDVPVSSVSAVLSACDVPFQMIGGILLNTSWQPAGLQSINEHAPIQYLDMIDENHALIVYRADFREYRDLCDADTVNFYLVSEKENHNILDAYDDLKGYYEYWSTYTTDLYYASKSQRSTAFSSVKIGDSCSDIAKIEPALSLITPFNTKFQKWSIIKILVEDGMIKFTFDNEQKLTAMEFHPYGEIYSNDGTEIFNILRAEKPVELPRG